jgi:hypothetical protein
MVLRAEDFLGSQSLEVRFEEMDEECSCEPEKPAAGTFQLSNGTGPLDRLRRPLWLMV